MAAPKNLLDQFKKGAGEAPQYFVLASTGRATTAKYVQSFDERAIMQEEPPTIAGGPKGSPKRDEMPDGEIEPGRLKVYDETSNIRADNQILVRDTPTSSKADKDARPNRLRIYRDIAGENIP